MNFGLCVRVCCCVPRSSRHCREKERVNSRLDLCLDAIIPVVAGVSSCVVTSAPLLTVHSLPHLGERGRGSISSGPGTFLLLSLLAQIRFFLFLSLTRRGEVQVVLGRESRKKRKKKKKEEGYI